MNAEYMIYTKYNESKINPFTMAEQKTLHISWQSKTQLS